MANVLRLLILDREYRCRLDHRFPGAPVPTPLPQHQLTDTESMQLITGMCYSLRTTLGKLVPSGPTPPVAFSYRTDRYRLAYYETASGWHFVLLTGLGPNTGATSSRAPSTATYGGITFSLERALEAFFTTVFLPWVVRNPLVDPQVADLDAETGSFKIKLTEFFALPLFA